jgi:hypothetical protein
LKKGFAAELDARANAFNKVKSELENLFAQQISEEDLKKDPTKNSLVENALRSFEAACTSYHGTLRGIKLAVETWVHCIIMHGSDYIKIAHGTCNGKLCHYNMFATTRRVQYQNCHNSPVS